MTKKTKRIIADFEEAVRNHEMRNIREEVGVREAERMYKQCKNLLLYHVGFLEAQAREEDK